MSELLILAGFMGAGKTTIGRLCARQLDCDFVDADTLIEHREGMTIPQVFERKGEAYFRQVESELVRELVTRKRTVIATGGGMIVDDDNRRALLAAGVCVGLRAAPQSILKRVNAETRPMLRGDDPAVRVAQLLNARAPAYAELHYTVDNTALEPEQTAQAVLAIYQAEQARIPVRIPAASARYDIVLGDGVLETLGYALAGRGYSAPHAIVTDEHVAPLHAERVQQSLARAGIDAVIHVLPPGESNKTLASVERMYRTFSARGLERASAVIAVGGGVVGDAAGFAAATYLRGVPFVQVPTSLLAMADSSIGGKVGVDTPFGKNLVGAFKQPDLVVIDTACLNTLPLAELRSGYAEIIKAALIAGGDAWQRIRDSSMQKGDFAADERLITTLKDAILLKRSVVEEDPYEKGRRALLNLGHTWGHGIEAWSQFRIRHGEAVALGMVCAVRASYALGYCGAALADEVVALLNAAGLPTQLAELDVDAVWRLMQSDKKKRAGALRFVLMRAPGDVFVCDTVSETQARTAVMSLREV